MAVLESRRPSVSCHPRSDALADTQLVLPGAKIVPATRCSMRGGGSLFAGSAEAAAGKGLPATVTATQEQVAALPAQLPELDGAPYVFVSFGNAAYFEMVHNWAKSVQLIGAPFIIAGEPLRRGGLAAGQACGARAQAAILLAACLVALAE